MWEHGYIIEIKDNIQTVWEPLLLLRTDTVKKKLEPALRLKYAKLILKTKDRNDECR